ncbi:MAG: PEP-CTERM sorting domain-containing protein [Blastocatellia bacterium]
MNFRPTLTLLLCGALAYGAQAGPIQYSQIGEAQIGQTTNRSTSTQSTSRTENANGSITIESLDQPEFVRLSDGRMIPYGPGVICSEVCTNSEVAENPPGLSRKWLIAIPIAGAAIAGFILVSGEASLPRPRPVVGGVSQEPSPTPTPTPTTTPTPSSTPPGEQPKPVPEPGTIALLGAGLALLSRKKIRTLFQRQP